MCCGRWTGAVGWDEGLHFRFCCLEGAITDGALIGDGPRVCCGGRTGAVGWDEGLHFRCLEGVGTHGPLIGGDGHRVCCGGWTGAVGWDEGLHFRFCCLEGAITDGALIGDGPRGCCGGRTGAVGWDEGLHFRCLEGVGTHGPLIGGDGHRVCCGGWTGAVGWDEGLHFCFCCLEGAITDGALIGGRPRGFCGGTGAVGWDEGFCFSCLEGVVAGCSVTFCAVFDITSPGTAAAGATSRGLSAMVTVLCSCDWCDNL